MAYWRWRAYDSNTTEHSGVKESPRFELVVIEIIQSGLHPGPIDKISYDEYIKLRPYMSRLDKLNEFKRKLQPSDKIQLPKTKLPKWVLQWIIKIVVLLLVGCASVLLTYHYLKQ